MSNPVFEVNKPCPVRGGGCACIGICQETMEVVAAADYWRVVGEDAENAKLRASEKQGPTGMQSTRTDDLAGAVRVYHHYSVGRWWRPTERSARKMVWGTFGALHPEGIDGTHATYTRAKIGYWVTVEQRFPVVKGEQA